MTLRALAHLFAWGRRACTVLGLCLLAGCGGEDAPDAPDAPVVQAPPEPVQVLRFPRKLHSDDERVNRFVEKAMMTCAAGSYDDFRVLWTAEQEPLARAEYDAGWEAVRLIQVRALEPVKVARDTEGGEVLEKKYVLLAEVRFDPEHPAGRKTPEREVVVLLTREQDRWRLARAPARIRTWVRRLVSGEATADSAAEGTDPAGDTDNLADRADRGGASTPGGV